ncbi:FAD-binding oxidoreductase [Rhodococcus sp. MS16]|uniref:NAD(P)/FAD-dependent oxidoreductase n=1 Tax=unclassified Rhodococcus (in: high G+C Gram-positive bacteria) TaxID=192944 RepID=UPI00122BC75A|nr:FAD-binding oxidoreductase [Rhodococcus sp. (in: high G+C Gram-positive bacteria)]NRI65372.1 FAD-binding oxidoreductase [Rhodococcus sp. MS16]RZL24721.1 MAG: FAD-binding oxidoreductase [Rhodococcus sp. (in: high G+C Gram-positive bacteria)]
MSGTFDAVIVGGGLLGCAAAWMLAREGADVLLVERDQINQHASGQNAGSLHFQLEYRMIEKGIEAAKQAAEAMPLHLEAAKLWADLSGEVGEPLGVAQVGGLMLAETEAQASLLETKAEIERSWGLDVEVLGPEQVRKVAPYLSESVVAASYCPIEGKADTRTAGPAMARAAIRLGATVRTRTAVTGIRRNGSSWLVTVADRQSGEQHNPTTVKAESLILTAGVWTTELGDMIGAYLPTIPLALTMTVTAKTEKFIPHLVQHAGARLSLKQSHDGNVLIGGGWPARLMTDSVGAPDFSVRPELLRSSVAGNARAATAVVPRVGSLPALRTWVGTTTVTPDQLPLVGPVPGAPGAYVATGGSAFTLGPSFAQVLTELVLGRKPGIDLAPYDPRRYERGIDVS